MIFSFKLHVKKLTEDAILPTKKHNNDAGFDLYANESMTLRPIEIDMWGQTVKVKTGISIEIPDGWFGLIRDRSSLGSQGILVLGGVIDSGYRGEIIVCLHNLNNKFYEIKKGDKIAQLLLIPVPQVDIVPVDSLSETSRGDKGFGSSGR